MLIEDLITAKDRISTLDLNTIRVECSQFIGETGGRPLYKNLPTTYPLFHRVKVRQRKHHDVVSEVFNQAFSTHFPKLRQRAVFAHPNPQHLVDDVTPYYIFPINGYGYLYSPEVHDSGMEYNQMLETLYGVGRLGISEAVDIVSGLLQYTYTDTNIDEAFKHNAELILFNIPYYYAVRASAVPEYRKILHNNIPI